MGVHVLTVNTEFMWRGLETAERFAFLPIYKVRTIFFLFSDNIRILYMYASFLFTSDKYCLFCKYSVD